MASSRFHCYPSLLLSVLAVWIPESPWKGKIEKFLWVELGMVGIVIWAIRLGGKKGEVLKEAAGRRGKYWKNIQEDMYIKTWICTLIQTSRENVDKALTVEEGEGNHGPFLFVCPYGVRYYCQERPHIQIYFVNRNKLLIFHFSSVFFPITICHLP